MRSQVSIFQSTPSAWRETYRQCQYLAIAPISIHSLRMEGDICPNLPPSRHAHFNPLPPHGGRLKISVTIIASCPFQSTPSAWRETNTVMQSYLGNEFQSTPSAWRETYSETLASPENLFQSTPSAWRETSPLAFRKKAACYFNPLPPHGGRPRLSRNFLILFSFQSTPSAWRETQDRS